MYCPQCGATNEDQAGFCRACGLDLNKYREQWQDPGAKPAGEAQPANSQSAQSSPAYQQPPYQQRYQPAYQPPPYQMTPQYRPVGPYGAFPRIPSYLGWAIAVLILCFWPTGIAAVVYATQVDNKLVLGDVAGAQESSRKAKMWCWITFGIGVGWMVLAIIGVVIALVVAGASHTFIY
jgi:hypothetical protein